LAMRRISAWAIHQGEYSLITQPKIHD
jgi:hypothetical protein